MLKIYDLSQQFKIDDGDWESCGSTGWYCKEEREVIPEILLADHLNWQDMKRLIEAAPSGILDGFEIKKTFFFKRPYISVSVGWWPNEIGRLYQNNPHTISYRVLRKENTSISMEWILENLPADKAIQYFKDRGMSVCPIATH